MKIKLFRLFSFFLISSTLFSCNEYNEIIKSGSNEEKKEAAIRYYNEAEYIKSITLLEDVLSFYKLTSHGEKLYFTYCMANYRLEDYPLAGYYFKRFIQQYPTSKNTEEALYLISLCSVHDSPDYTLDQTETYNALDQLQIFIDQYPNSNRVDTCNLIMDGLRAKLELKQFEYAKLYYRTQRYQSAVVALNQTLEKFPESKYKEDIYYLLVKSNFELAINSVDTKKMERLDNTIKSYRTFVAEFPNSSKLSEIESIRKQTERALKEG